MKKLNKIHHDAMRLADEAEQLRRRGKTSGAASKLRQAFALERQAAELSARPPALEPTRSVLHRSAAVLALECQDYREAERLIAVALAGDPPAEIAEELRDLLEQVYFDGPVRRGRRSLTTSARRKRA